MVAGDLFQCPKPCFRQFLVIFSAQFYDMMSVAIFLPTILNVYFFKKWVFKPSFLY